MKPRSWSFQSAAIVIFLSSACATTGVNPTGLTGGQVMCPMGPRPALDCRGVLQQYARDLKADLNMMSKVQIGLGLTTTKLTEADALTSDLLQHSYQTCTLYNACINTPEEYAAKQERLQNVQMEVRRALVAGGLYGQQQNIQINPLHGQPFPPQFPGGAVPAPGSPLQGVPQSGVPGQIGGGLAFGDPNAPQPGIPQEQQFLGPPAFGQAPAGISGPAPKFSANVPNPKGAQAGEAILNILRNGSKAVRGVKASTASAKAKTAVKQPEQDLDTALRGMLQTLKQNVARRSPALASGRAVVGNFTEANRPWSSPLGALLQDRVSAIAGSDELFKQSTAVRYRGITVKEVPSAGNINDPKTLTSLYNTDLAIAGTYQPAGDQIVVKLTAYQNAGEIAQTTRTIPANLIPDVVAAAPQNAPETGQLIKSLGEIGPRADGMVNLTTNRPGAGSTFRLGEEIIYFVTAKTGGYVYLFHADAEKGISQIFPNQYQREARIQPAQVVQVPAGGAPFKFEASPPFGLETTFAIVTSGPLDENDLQAIQNGLTGPQRDVATVLKTRGIGVVPATTAAAGAPVQWTSTTVLIRP